MRSFKNESLLGKARKVKLPTQDAKTRRSISLGLAGTSTKMLFSFVSFSAKFLSHPYKIDSGI